jgi:alkylation response protein AidB-like acyl-CoA dehydrogenase
MKVERVLPTPEATELLELVADIARESLAPRAALAERDSSFPRDAFVKLGASGLLGLPYPEEYGGAAQPYEVYLQVIEELSRAWLTVGLGISVHTLSCFPLARFGTDEQRVRWLPDMLGGALLGAYCLSEPDSGSDAGALRTRAEPAGDGYRLSGTKAWITHAGHADFYTVMARTSDNRSHGISCFLVPADAQGIRPGVPEKKMGLRGSPTAQLQLDDVAIGSDRIIGDEGQGFTIALAALDTGRLGIAACSVGLAQAALDVAVDYARQRRQFGQPIGDFEGVGFLLADMATGVAAGRAVYLAAARRADRGAAFTMQAAMAKLFCTDMAMRVTTDAVQVLGGYGYVEDYPVERYLREAKALQIVEGTNEVQRLVISRQLRQE